MRCVRHTEYEAAPTPANTTICNNTAHVSSTTLHRGAPSSVMPILLAATSAQRCVNEVPTLRSPAAIAVSQGGMVPPARGDAIGEPSATSVELIVPFERTWCMQHSTALERCSARTPRPKLQACRAADPC